MVLCKSEHNVFIYRSALMAKLALQLQNFLVAFIFFVIVINKHVSGTSEPLKIQRDGHDIFDNPTCQGQNGFSNCTAMNAHCSITQRNSRCPQCTCSGEYRTYLLSFGKCVKDKKLLFLPVSMNSFLIQEYQSETKCITYNRSNHLTLAKCKSSDPSQKWIWTWHNQILHVKTLKCIQHGEAKPDPSSTTLYMDLDLKNCNISETKQKWKCNEYLLEKLQRFEDTSGQVRIMRITYTKDIINAQADIAKRWKRHDTNTEKICSSSSGCDEFANLSSSSILVLDTKGQWKGEQEIADLSDMNQCNVDNLQFWKYDTWKRLESTKKVFLINNNMDRKFLKWNLTQAPLNWSNLIIKINFNCTLAPQSSTKESKRCVLIKIKYSQNAEPENRTTTSYTQPETSPTGSFTSNGTLDTSLPSSTTNTKSPTESSTSTGTRNTSPPSITTNTETKTESFSRIGATNTSLSSSSTKAKSPTSSKEKQQAESSSVVGIVVGLLATILVISGIIIGFFYYKRKGRLDKTTSKVKMNEHSSGDTQNPIYSSEDKDSSLFINDAGIYQEPDENMSEASQACGLYESVDDRKSDNLETKQENKPAPSLEELKYDYVTNDDVRSATQRLPAKGNNYHISNKNPPTNKSENKETENDNEVLYHTLEDDACPVYQTLEDE